MSRSFLLLVGVAAMLLAPWLLADFGVIEMNYIGIASVVVLGLALLTGGAGVISFGQQVFVGLGAYATAVVSTQMGVSPWGGLLLGLALAGLVALFLGAITLRLSGHYLPVATLAWGISIYFLFGNLEFLGSHSGLTQVPPIAIGQFRLDSPRSMYYLIWIALLALLLACSNLMDSRMGRAIRAVRARASMAQSFGINAYRLKLAIFVIAAALAGFAGWLYAHFLGFVSPGAFSVKAGIDYLFMVVIGGASQVWGALLGASLYIGFKDLLANLLPTRVGGAGNYEAVILGALILLVLHRSRTGLAPVVGRILWRPPARSIDLDDVTLPPRTYPAEGPLLRVDAVAKRFGGLQALQDMSLELHRGELLGLIGPNGAGKSTLFNVICGDLRADSGSIVCHGEQILGIGQDRIAGRGIVRTFQHVHLIGEMSVLENVAIGAHLRAGSGILASMLRLDRAEERALLAEAARQIDKVGLTPWRDAAAGTLSLGQQRLVEIARALCASPSILILDEPAAGLRYAEKQALAALLRTLRTEGMSILLVEHDMDFLMNLADRVVVMQAGGLLVSGQPGEVRADPRVIEAYLGSAP